MPKKVDLSTQNPSTNNLQQTINHDKCIMVLLLKTNKHHSIIPRTQAAISDKTKTKNINKLPLPLLNVLNKLSTYGKVLETLNRTSNTIRNFFYQFFNFLDISRVQVVYTNYLNILSVTKLISLA